MSQGKRYVFTGGGTLGHVTPNLAIIRHLQSEEPEAEFLYLGSRGGPEREKVASRGILFRGVFAKPFASPRKVWAFSRFALHLTLGTIQALWHLMRFKPHVVVATGGYASVPAALAAALLRRPIFLHEQNIRPGRANLLLARLATRIGVSFEETLQYFPKEKTRLTGYPVRKRIGSVNRIEARERLAIPADQRVAFIVGGSMGSRSINRGVVEGLGRLLSNENVTVIHSTGLADGLAYHAWKDTKQRLDVLHLPDGQRSRYIVKRYIEQIEDAYAASDLVVTRAGAGVVMELAAMGKPALLIPKSDGADNHQLVNAVSLRDRGMADVLFEEMYDSNEGSLTRVHGDQLARKIDDLLGDADQLAAMAQSALGLAVPDAAPQNAAVVRELAVQGKRPVHRETVQELVGSVVDNEGREVRLIFPLTRIAGSSAADISLPKGSRAVAWIRRIGGKREETEFLLVPRRGPVRLEGEILEDTHKLAPGQTFEVGGRRFQFLANIHTREAARPPGGLVGKILATGLGTLLSRVFGLLREITLATAFGAGHVLDVFAASLTASNLFRRIFAENAMESAFLPTYLMLRREGRKGDAANLFASMLTWTLLGTSLVVGVSILTVDTWLPWLVPGFAAKGLLQDAETLTRLMLPYLVLVSAAALLGAVHRAGNRFAVPAWASVFFSLGVILGVFLYPSMGFTGLGLGVLIGGAGQLVIHVPALTSRRFRERVDLSFRPRLGLDDPGMRKVRSTAPMIVADVTVGKISPLVDVAIVSTLAVGSVSVLYLGLLLVQLPFALVSQSINTVAMKEFSESLAARDRKACLQLISQGLRWSIFLLLPVSVALAIFSGPLVNLLLRYRHFDAGDARNVSLALSCYALGLLGWGLTALTGRFFAARLELGRATLINLGAVILNVALSVSLVLMGFGFAGIALGTTVAMLAGGLYRVHHLNQRLRGDGEGLEAGALRPTLRATILATGAAALVGSLMSATLTGFHALPEFLSRLTVLGLPAIAFGVTFAAASWALGSPEMKEIVGRLSRLLPRRPDRGNAQPPLNPRCLRPEALLAAAEHHPDAVRMAKPLRRVKDCLSRESWKQRNIGVKLVGLLGFRSLRHEILRVASERRPDTWRRRLLGGDFVEPGFLRRNAVLSLIQLDVHDEELERILPITLCDPYWEVRVAAAKMAAHFAPLLTPDVRRAAVQRLTTLLRERNFEVVAAATEALQAVALDKSILSTFETLHDHPNWQVRNAVARAYQELYRRGVIEDRDLLLARVLDILVTCDSFHPTFELKETLRRVTRTLSADTPAQEAPPASLEAEA